MSVLTRKRPDVFETVTVRARLVPIAKNASPMAKNAGRAAKDRAEELMTWAMPYIDNARVWAAPQLERTGVAVRDNVAPKVSSLLVTTARRLDKAPPKRRRWPRMLGTMAMLAAAGTAAAAVAMRRRAYSLGYEPGTPCPAVLALVPRPRRKRATATRPRPSQRSTASTGCPDERQRFPGSPALSGLRGTATLTADRVNSGIGTEYPDRFPNSLDGSSRPTWLAL